MKKILSPLLLCFLSVPAFAQEQAPRPDVERLIALQQTHIHNLETSLKGLRDALAKTNADLQKATADLVKTNTELAKTNNELAKVKVASYSKADSDRLYLTQAESDKLFLTQVEADKLFLKKSEGDCLYEKSKRACVIVAPDIIKEVIKRPIGFGTHTP